jgi:bifunctional enzyme CysN/CysC
LPPDKQRACVLWLTGLPAAGKSTLASELHRRLQVMQRPSYVLDGDEVRRGLSRDLGFSEADRTENVRRIAEVARLMAGAGLIVIVALVSPYRTDRRMARTILAEGRFVEIFVDTPLAEAERRDPKGLYRRARRGELANLTGVGAPYEAPENPELRVATLSETPEASAGRILAHLGISSASRAERSCVSSASA